MIIILSYIVVHECPDISDVIVMTLLWNANSYGLLQDSDNMKILLKFSIFNSHPLNSICVKKLLEPVMTR